MKPVLIPAVAAGPSREHRPHERSRLVRIYGDSLSLPRHADGVSFSATYGETFCAWLRSESGGQGVSLYNRSRGGATAPVLARLAEEDTAYFGKSTSQLVLVHCGICDCAPRPIPLWLRHGIGRMPGRVQGSAIRLLHDARPWLQRRGFVWRHTKPELFQTVVTAWLKELAAFAQAVFVINIAPPTGAIEEHSPGLARSVVLYNELLQRAVGAAGPGHVELVDVHRMLLNVPGAMQRCINQVDGHHLTVDGHALYLEALQERYRGMSDSLPPPS